MSLRKYIGMEGGVQDLQFELKPKSIVFEKSSIPCFAIYLQKGAQVVGYFHSGNMHNPKETLYRFKNPEGKRFRLKNLSHATYTWNIYQMNPVSSTEQLEDSVTINIKRIVESYQLELQQKEREIQTSVKDKSVTRKQVLQTWQKVKRQMRTNRPILKSLFPKISARFQFQLEIFNSLDLELEEEQKNMHKMRRSRSYSGDFRPSVPNKVRLGSQMLVKNASTDQLVSNSKESHPQLKNTTGGKFSTKIKEFLDTKESERGEDHLDPKMMVEVINPSGKVINLDDQNEFVHYEPESDLNKENKLYVLPSKKFSLLSDIIQRSHEGSSTIGRDKFSSTDRCLDRKDYVLQADSTLDHKNLVNVQSPLLNKFKTLPYEHYQDGMKANSNDTADLRRAQTAQKVKMQIDESSEYANGDLSDIKMASNKSEIKSLQEKSIPSSGDHNAKYIILTALIIILTIIGREWFFECHGKKCTKAKIKTQQPKQMKVSSEPKTSKDEPKKAKNEKEAKQVKQPVSKKKSANAQKKIEPKEKAISKSK